MPDKRIDPYSTIPDLTSEEKIRYGLERRAKKAVERKSETYKQQPKIREPLPPERQREQDLKTQLNITRKRELNEALNSTDGTNYKVK